MVHPLLYDIRKVLLSKTVLISMALLIAISFFLVYSFSVTTTSQFQNSNNQILSWYDSSGTYHFLVFDTNQYGQPVSGVSVQVSMNVSTSQLAGNGQNGNTKSFPGYQSSHVATNSSGIAVLTISVPPADISVVNANYSVSIQFNQANGFSNGFEGGTPYTQFKSLANGSTVPSEVAPGQVVSVFNGPITPVSSSSNSQAQNIMVTWAGPNGSVPARYSLYYKFINSTCIEPNNCVFYSPSPNTITESNMTLLGTLTTYNQIFNPPKLESNLGNGSQIILALFDPSGNLTQYSSNSVGQIYPTPQAISVGQSNEIVISYFSTVFGIFIPLIAIIGSYNSYGKDRVSGVLESILAQPISRRGLSLSRFFSTFAGMAIAISISMGVVDAIVIYYAKTPVSSTLLLASAGAFFAELGAFIGIMMLLSRVIKSSGLLIGIGIGLFLIFDLFWSVIILALVSATGAGFGSNTYLGLQVAGEFVNPAQFIQLVIAYLTSQGPFGPFSPTQFGITIPSIVATGIIWVALPLAGFLYLAIKRD
jgi:ABC-2 type transport system permease protein